MKFVLEYTNSQKLQIYTADRDAFEKLRYTFSCENVGAFFAKKYSRFVPDRLYAITGNGYSELGLFWDIKMYLDDNKHEVELGSRLQQILAKEPIQAEYSLNLELRDYQKEALDICLKSRCGTFILGTGAGKTLLTAALIESYSNYFGDEFKCIVIVPDIGLIEQTYKEFINYGVNFTVSKWSGKNKLQYTNVVICTLQILQARFDKNEWIKYIDLLICDEAHKIRSNNSISDLIKQIKTTDKFGFTGTLPKNDKDRWSIVGKFGPVNYTKSSTELRNEGFLTNCEATVIEVEYNTKVKRTNRGEYRDELEFIYTNSYRNELIWKLCASLEGNTLILINHLQHCDELLAANNQTEKQVVHVRGDVDVDTREQIKAKMETESNICCVAMSSIFSTGINIKNINNIILASGGKSFVRIVQSVGRGLRLHRDKNKLKIIDICDKLHYSMQHAIERIKIYKEENIPFKTKLLRQP